MKKRFVMEIRKATIDDAAAIARNVMAALDYAVYSEELDDKTGIMLEAMTEICGREDTLYSWRNTIVACEGGEVAGSLTSYDGSGYSRMRELTFRLFHEKMGWETPVMDDETKAGEWYLDSLAVSPSFRRKGIARLLIGQSLEIAEALGFTTVSLIALSSSERLIAFYEACGFHPDGHLNCFGHDYLRMVTYL